MRISETIQLVVCKCFPFKVLCLHVDTLGEYYITFGFKDRVIQSEKLHVNDCLGCLNRS